MGLAAAGRDPGTLRRPPNERTSKTRTRWGGSNNLGRRFVCLSTAAPPAGPADVAGADPAGLRTVSRA